MHFVLWWVLFVMVLFVFWCLCFLCGWLCQFVVYHVQNIKVTFTWGNILYKFDHHHYYHLQKLQRGQKPHCQAHSRRTLQSFYLDWCAIYNTMNRLLAVYQGFFFHIINQTAPYLIEVLSVFLPDLCTLPSILRPSWLSIEKRKLRDSTISWFSFYNLE